MMDEPQPEVTTLKRKPIPNRLRYEIMRRDNHACRYCGQMAPDVKLTIDHVTPVVLGGSDDPDNLVTACKDCNAGKSSVAPGQALVDDVSSDAIRWAKAQAEAVRSVEAAITSRDALHATFLESWEGWTNAMGHTCPLPDDWRTSINQWAYNGVTDKMLVEAVSIAMGKKIHRNDVWRYFCGVVWKTVAQIREATAAIAAKEAVDDQ